MDTLLPIISLHSLVLVGSAVFAILSSLVVLVKQFWLVGLFLIIAGIAQIAFICTTGAIYQSLCERFEQRLYNSKWNHLSVQQQKKLILIMQIAQRPKLLSIGNIEDANFNTFLRVRMNIIKSGP